MTAYVQCPGEDLHTTQTGERDCWLKIDGAPTFKCMHNSCSEAVEAEQFRVRSNLGKAFPNYAGTIAPIEPKATAAMPRLPFKPIAPPPPVEEQCLNFVATLFDDVESLAIGRAVWQNLGKGRYIPVNNKIYGKRYTKPRLTAAAGCSPVTPPL